MEITVSLETAQRLKDKGFPQKNITFTWYQAFPLCGVDTLMSSEGAKLRVKKLNTTTEVKEIITNLLCAAPTAEEILAELPDVINEKNTGDAFCLLMSKQTISNPHRRWFYSSYWHYGREAFLKGSDCNNDNNLAEALASLWLWCVDNGYITVEVK